MRERRKMKNELIIGRKLREMKERESKEEKRYERKKKDEKWVDNR